MNQVRSTRSRFMILFHATRKSVMIVPLAFVKAVHLGLGPKLGVRVEHKMARLACARELEVPHRSNRDHPVGRFYERVIRRDRNDRRPSP